MGQVTQRAMVLAVRGDRVACGSRARIRTSVERTKTACPAWLDDPGRLRRKLYPEAGRGPAERVGRARRASGGVDQAGLPCISAECPMLASADSEVDELLRM